MLHLSKESMIKHALSSFRKLNKLIIDISTMSQSWPIETTSTAFDHIQALQLNATQDTSKEDLSRILFSGAIHFESVIKLVIRNLNIDWNEFYQYSYLFPNVQHLALDTVTINDSVSIESDDSDSEQEEKDEDEDEEEAEERRMYKGLEVAFPKLNALILRRNSSTKFCKKMINIFGHKLNKLSIKHQSATDMAQIAKVIDSKKMDILALPCNLFYNVMISPHSKSLNLKGAKINYGIDECTNIEIKQVIEFLLSRQSLIEYIHIDLKTMNEMANISSKIADAIIESRDDIRKNKLKIRLYINKMKAENVKEVRTNIFKIITAFTYYYKENDWMLVGDWRCDDECNKLFTEQVYLNMYSIYEGRNKIWISNKDCKINRCLDSLI